MTAAPANLTRRIVLVAFLVALTPARDCAAQSSVVPGASDLMIAPKDPLAYYRARQEVARLVASSRFADAEPLAERLTREFPRDGENWYFLARSRAGIGKHRDAALAFERAGTILGWYDPYWTDRNAAYAYVDAGDHAKALAVLDRAVFEHQALYRGSLFDYPRLSPLREYPEFRRIAGRPSIAGLTRTTGWQLDIDHLRAELERVNPDYRGRALPVQLDSILRSVRANIANLSDDQVVVGINRALASLRQGHTGIWFWPADSGRFMPLELQAFPEGIFVTAATPAYAALLGTRLIEIEGVPAADVLARINSIMSVDGEMEYLSVGVIRMQDLRLLRGLGVTGRVDSLRVLVENTNGRQVRTTIASERTRQQKRGVLDHAGAASAPLYLVNGRQAHWDTTLDARTMYVQVNNIADDADETLAAFGIRLRRTLEKSPVRNIIVDVRRNAGGNTDLYTELLRTLVGFSAREGTQLYVIIGRVTYSAAANLVTDLERLAAPIFIGEPTGECCNLHGDFSAVLLPYSQVRGRLTGVHWNRSTPWDGRREIVPHVPVQITFQDYLAGRDPVLESVRSLIRQRE